MGEARKRGTYENRKNDAFKRSKEKLLRQLREREQPATMLLSPLMVTTDKNGFPDIVGSVHNTSIKQAAYINRHDMETDHINHFRSLVSSQLPDYDFIILGPEKNDPPDFWIERNGKSIGIELTMFMFQELRQEVKFFHEIQDKILDRYLTGGIANIQGVEIELWFGNYDTNRPRHLEIEEFEELITHFNKLASKPFEKPINDDFLTSIASPYPLGQEGSIGKGFIGWRVVNLGHIIPKTDLGRVAGFEVSHSLKFYSKADFFNRLEAIINAKDKEKNRDHELLISVGMKDMDGWITTLEAVCLSLIIDEWMTIQKSPQFLSAIYLDFWNSNKVRVLYDRQQFELEI